MAAASTLEQNHFAPLSNQRSPSHVAVASLRARSEPPRTSVMNIAPSQPSSYDMLVMWGRKRSRTRAGA